MDLIDGNIVTLYTDELNKIEDVIELCDRLARRLDSCNSSYVWTGLPNVQLSLMDIEGISKKLRLLADSSKEY